ncbi:MAG TPA: hypothetical protein VMH33_07445 [Solirubrobacterales bacterium]|nr:hypothetical protein [Solirubrobacterales bacterium]
MGVVTLLAFAVWAVLSVGLILALIANRRPNTVFSPASRIVISAGLPGSTKALLTALERADVVNRSYIAEAAILIPVNNQRATNELAQAFGDLEEEIGALIASAPAFDERWLLQWKHKPSWAEKQPYSGRLFSGEMLDELGRYMAMRGRQIGWMIDFLNTGNDKPVRHIRSWIRAAERKNLEAEDGEETNFATRRASSLS